MGDTVRLETRRIYGSLIAEEQDSLTQDNDKQPVTSHTFKSENFALYEPTGYAEMSDWRILRLLQQIVVFMFELLDLPGYDSNINEHLFHAIFPVTDMPDLDPTSFVGDKMVDNALNLLKRAQLKNLKADDEQLLRFLSEFCQNEEDIPLHLKNSLSDASKWATAMKALYEDEQVISNRPKLINTGKSFENLCHQVMQNPDRHFLEKKLTGSYLWLSRLILRPDSLNADSFEMARMQDARLSSTVDEILKKIQSLSDNEQCLIPSSLGHGRNHLFLRVQKTGDTFKLTLITRDQEIQSSAVIAAAGKRKVIAGIPYCGVNSKEFANANFIRSFLLLSSPTYQSSDALQALSLRTGKTKKALLDLLAPLHKNQDLSAQKGRFRTMKPMATAVSNVWAALFDDTTLFPHTRQHEAVLKFKLKLKTLYGFYAKQHAHLEDNEMVCHLLKKGVMDVRRDLIFLEERNFITSDFVSHVTKELDQIKRSVDQAEKVLAPPPPKKIPLGYSTSIQRASHVKTPLDAPKQQKVSLNNHHPAVAYKYKHTASFNRPISQVKTITSKDGIAGLQDLETKFNQLIAHRQNLEAQVFYMEMVDMLPFEQIINDFNFEGSIWDTMSVDDREEASRILYEMSQKFHETITLTQTILPDRFYAMIKCGAILELLAKLNKERTGFKWIYFVGMFRELTGHFHKKKRTSYKASYFHDSPGSHFYRFRSTTFHEKVSKLEKALDDSTMAAACTTRQGPLEKAVTILEREEDQRATPPVYARFDDYFHRHEARKIGGASVVGFEVTVAGDHIPVDDKVAQNRHLRGMVKLFNLFLGSAPDNYLKDTHHRSSLATIRQARFPSKDELLNARVLGRPFETNGMLSAAAETYIGYNESDPMLQEAMTMHPEGAFQSAVNRLKGVLRGRKDVPMKLPPGIEEEDLTAILKALDPRLGIGHALALLKQKPYLISIPDVRNAIEHVFLDLNNLESNLKRYPNLISDMVEIFKEVFEVFVPSHGGTEIVDQRQIVEGLFIIHLSRTLRDMIANTTDYDNNLYRLHSANFCETHERLPQFQSQIQKWVLHARSAENDSDIYAVRPIILSMYLKEFSKKDSLSEYEISEMLLSSMQLSRDPIFETDEDPVLTDQVKKLLAQWTPVFQDVFQNEKFKDAFLQSVCKFFIGQIPKGAWKGSFPRFECDQVEVNLSTGYILLKGSGRSKTPLSSAALRILRAACPDTNLKEVEQYRLECDCETYEFKDNYGTLNRIEIDGSESRYYKQIEQYALDPKSGHPIACKVWYQHVQESDLKAKAELPWYISKIVTHMSNALGFDLAKVLFSTASIPKFALGTAQFVNPNDPTQIMTCDADGKPMFNLDFQQSENTEQWSRAHLRGIFDIRPEFKKRNIGKVLSIAGSRENAEFLKAIERFESLDQVLLWGNGKDHTLEGLELPRLGLLFHISHGKLICQSEPYAGYTLNMNPTPTENKGLGSAIVLDPPDTVEGKLKDRILLLAKSEDISYEYTFSMPADLIQLLIAFSMKLISEAAKSRFLADLAHRPRLLKMFLQSIPLEMNWSINPKKLKRTYTSFHIPPIENEIRPPQNAKLEALIDFVLHMQTEVSSGNIECMQTMAEVMSNMRCINENDFELFQDADRCKDFLKQISRMVSVAKKGTGPEKTGIGIRVLIALRHQLPGTLGELGNAIDDELMNLFEMYLQTGKRCDLRARLSDLDIAYCFDVASKKRKNLFVAYGHFYRQDPEKTNYEHDQQIVRASFGYPPKERHYTVKPITDQYELAKITSCLKYASNAAAQYRPYFLYGDILPTFRGVYEKMRTTQPNTDEYEILKTTLEQLDPSSLGSDFNGELIRYVKRLCSYREQHPQDPLPEIPDQALTHLGYRCSPTKHVRQPEIEYAMEEEVEAVKLFFAALNRRIVDQRNVDNNDTDGNENKIDLIKNTVSDLSHTYAPGLTNQLGLVASALGVSIETIESALPQLALTNAAGMAGGMLSPNLIQDGLAAQDILPGLINQLTELVSRIPEGSPADTPPIQAMRISLNKLQAAKTQVGEFAKKTAIDRTSAMTEGLPIAALEQLIKDKRYLPSDGSEKDIKDAKLVSITGNCALFTKEEMPAWFEETTAPTSKPRRHRLKFDDRGNDAASLDARRLNEEMRLAEEQSPPKFYVLKKNGGKVELKTLKAKLIAKRDAAKKDAETAKQQIEEVLAFHSDAVANATFRAGLSNPVSWTELLTSYYRDELPSLQSRLPKNTDLKLVKTYLRSYFQESVRAKWAHNTYCYIDWMEKDEMLDCAHTCTELYSRLTRSNAFDANIHPEIELIQLFLGFIIKEEQLEFAEGLLANDSVLKQARTGMGKTTVIMLLVALLKPNGTNLVTLKFPTPLLKSARKHLTGALGTFLRRRVTTFQFKTSDPTKIRENGQVTSVFKTRYKKLLSAVINREVILTDLRSFTLMEEKLIALINKHHNVIGRDPADFSEEFKIEAEHIYYLSKIYMLLQSREVTLFDEHDQMLSIFQQIRYCTSKDDTENISPHIINTVIDVVDAFRKDERLGLEKNAESDLLEADRDALIRETAEAFATEFADTHHLDRAALTAYFTDPKTTEMPEDLAKLSDKHALDRAVLLMQLFSLYAPLNLSHKASRRYILAKDGIFVVPTESPDKPRANSRFDAPPEELFYTCKWYYQKGVSKACLNAYIQELKNNAIADFARDPSAYASIDDTDSGQLFKELSKPKVTDTSSDSDVKLSKLSEQIKNELLVQVNQDPDKIRIILERFVLPRIRLFNQVTSATAHDIVAQSRCPSGISATQGCVDGYSNSFNKNEARIKGALGQSLVKLLRRLEGGDVIVFQPDADPVQVIHNIKKRAPNTGIIIDGPSDLAGAEPQVLALELLQGGTFENVTYFDKEGKKHTLDKNGKIMTDAELRENETPLSRCATLYTASQSRGTDHPNSPSVEAVWLPERGKGGSLEEFDQNLGRLRRSEHKCRVALPATYIMNFGNDLRLTLGELEKNPQKLLNNPCMKDQVKDARDYLVEVGNSEAVSDWSVVSEIIIRTLLNRAQKHQSHCRADELFRNRLAEIRCITRHDALNQLAAIAIGVSQPESADLTDTFANDTEMTPHEIATAAQSAIHRFYDPKGTDSLRTLLVNQKPKIYSTPGEFAKAFSTKIRNDADSVQTLNSVRQRALDQAQALGLIRATKLLPLRTYEEDANNLPKGVSSNIDSNGPGQESETEMQMETETSMDQTLTQEKAKSFEAMNYHRWRNPDHHPHRRFNQLNGRNKITKKYPDNLLYTTNFIPDDRQKKSGISGRQAHDAGQNTLDHVIIESNATKSTFQFIACDSLDVEYYTTGNTHADDFSASPYHRYRCIMDMRTRQVIYRTGEAIFDLTNTFDTSFELALMRAESGQLNGYTKNEIDALRGWMRNWTEQEIQDYRDYISEEVLAYKAKDKQFFGNSQLNRMMQQIITDRRAAHR